MVFTTTKLATKPKVDLFIRRNNLEVRKLYLILVVLFFRFVVFYKNTDLNTFATDSNSAKTYCKVFERTAYPIIYLYY